MGKILKINLIATILSGVLATVSGYPSTAGEADVVDVKVTAGSRGYGFSVTLKHKDEGWDHYANVWEVVGPDGTVYGTRVLAHPHVNEQPFARSLSGVKIPEGISEVEIRAGDSVHALGGETIKIALPK